MIINPYPTRAGRNIWCKINDGIIDDEELNKIIRDAFVLGLKNKGLKNDNAMLEKKVSGGVCLYYHLIYLLNVVIS